MRAATPVAKSESSGSRYSPEECSSDNDGNESSATSLSSEGTHLRPSVTNGNIPRPNMMVHPSFAPRPMADGGSGWGYRMPQGMTQTAGGWPPGAQYAYTSNGYVGPPGGGSNQLYAQMASYYGMPPQAAYMRAYEQAMMRQAYGSRVPSAAMFTGGTSSPRSSTDSSTVRLDQLPVYATAAEAPSRLPAHKPVRLQHPKHALAPSGTPVFFKYGEEHYPEETVPRSFSHYEPDGTVCRYISNFLVYNKRGERLLPLEVLDQPRHSALILYGSLLAAATATPKGREIEEEEEIKIQNDDRQTESYPVRVELVEWLIDYGHFPKATPYVWLVSRYDIFYRLERPAGRYVPTFSTARVKFEVATRIIKTLHMRPDSDFKLLVELITAANRYKKALKRKSKDARIKEESDGDVPRVRRGSKASGGSKQGEASSGSSFEDVEQPSARTPWGSLYAVEGVRESTILGLEEFLDGQLKSFVEGMVALGDRIPNLLATPFMHTLKQKAALRRDTLNLVETKRRVLESLASVEAGAEISPELWHRYFANSVSQSPTGTLSTEEIAAMVVKTRMAEEEELRQLTQLLREFSDDETDTNQVLEEFADDDEGASGSRSNSPASDVVV